MNVDQSLTAAFTGHRNYDGCVDEALRQTITTLFDRGIHTFLSGMAVGFDLAAAEAVLELRLSLPELRLIAVVPFVGQAYCFPVAERVRYDSILAAADQTIVIEEHYTPACYAHRNDFLVDQASVLVAYYDGSTGGTRYTVKRARRLKSEVLNLWIDPQLEIPNL